MTDQPLPRREELSREDRRRTANPCPLCGGAPAVSRFEIDDDGTLRWAVACNGSEAPEDYIGDEHYCQAFGSSRSDAITAWNRRTEGERAAVGGVEWRPIDEGAPRDGTLFMGCNLDHPSFGSWPMYRRVRHAINEAGEWTMEDRGGWIILNDVEPDYQEGHATGPDPAFAIAPDDLNISVRYGWMPLPSSGGGDARAWLPESPTREMWEAMGNAVVKIGPPMPVHHDIISEAVYDALRAMISARPDGLRAPVVVGGDLGVLPPIEVPAGGSAAEGGI